MNDYSENDNLRGSFFQENSSIHLMNVESSLTPNKDRRGFYAHLEVGSIRTSQFVYFDTGSSLLWINCEPSGSVNIPEPYFFPAESSTYKTVNCNDSRSCGALGGASSRCDLKRRCHFTLQYVGAKVEGHIAKEDFRFGESDEIFRDILFGCTTRSRLFVNGVLGFSTSRVSLVAQMSFLKFSHCFGNISDRTYKYNTLLVGDAVELMGSNQTPMIIEGKYYITLEGIKIGNTLLKIDPRIFVRNPDDYTGGMIVDTGSTYTFLPKQVVEMVETEIIDLIEFSLIQNHSHWVYDHNMLCYDGIIGRDLTGFPTVSFLFKGDATMELVAENIFRQVTDQTFCVWIIPSENIELPSSLLGNHIMQYFYFVYDLVLKKLSFVEMECSSLGDYVVLPE